jgi:hypothetical protein
MTQPAPFSFTAQAGKKADACAAGGRGDPCTRYQENREIARTRFRSQVREEAPRFGRITDAYFLTEPESEMLSSTFRDYYRVQGSTPAQGGAEPTVGAALNT